MKKAKQNYIDSNKLHDLITQWKEDRKNKKEMNKELVNMFLLILNGVISKPTYNQFNSEDKDDMKQIAFINLFLYIHNYKPEKSKSKNAAFTYVTFSIETSYKSTITRNKVKSDKQQNYIDLKLEDIGYFEEIQ